MKSTHKNSVWAGIWNQQQLWMLRIWRKDFCVTLQYSKSTLNQCPRQQFCFKPALTWSLSKRIKIPLSPPPTYFQRAFHCVYEQGSSLPVFPHCTIGFPRASLAAPALLESRVYSSPPLSASRWGGGLWWGLDATECQCQKWPFSWKSGAGVRHCPCKKGETLLFYFFSSPFLGDYIWTDDLWLSRASQVPDLSSGLISPSPPSPTLLHHLLLITSN